MAARVLIVATSGELSGDHASALSHGHELERMSPLIVVPRFAETRQAIANLSRYRTIALTSGHAVDALVGGLRALGHDVRALFGIKLAVVGAATAARLERYGLVADLVADGGGEKLAEEILQSGFGDPILYPRALDGHPALVDALVAAGRRVDAIAAYETAPDTTSLKAALLRHAETPYAAFAFASPKGARALVGTFGVARMRDAIIGAIGETTRAALESLGFERVLVAERPSLEVLVELVAAHVRDRRGA